MFTGLVEEIGAVVSAEPAGDGVRVSVRAPLVASDAAIGDSISVSGVCLTVIGFGKDWFSADVMAETLAVVGADAFDSGNRVNLERAVRADSRLGGHIVQGHVDGVAEVLEVRPGAKWSVLRIGLPRELAPLVAHKGSIAVDGVSLTVSAVGSDWFEVSLIPETLEATTLGAIEPGDPVRLETDIIARQVARMLEFQDGVERSSWRQKENPV